MLTRLHIKNIALIKECELIFDGNFTVITGETGAGKSMLIDSLSLALGARCDTSLIRHGEKQASIEAVFNMSPKAILLLEKWGLDTSIDELILRRIITGDKSRGFINNNQVTQSQLKELGDMLVDIHGQFDHQMLLRADKHAELLDSFARLNKERSNVYAAYKNFTKASKLLTHAKERITNKGEQEDLIRSYVNEIELLAPVKGEDKTLADERNYLIHSEKLVEALTIAKNSLEGESDVIGGLGKAQRAISTIENNGGTEIADISTRLNSLNTELSDIVSDINRLGNNFEPNPKRLTYVDERLFALKDCARKHGVEIDGLLAVQSKLLDSLAELTSLHEDISVLEAEVKKTRIIFINSCNVLSKGRHKQALKLAKLLESSLTNLNMEDTKFVVQLTLQAEDKWNEYGSEKVEFLVSTNAGTPLSPLIKVASGGEVSRLMLALKQVFYETLPPTTLVFDEIDVGVGGSTADKVGLVMGSLALRHQVFAITHQPQVAAKGKVHMHISKSTNSDGTVTSVTILEKENRINEIARMLSGATITDAARNAASSLLKG